MRARSSSLGVGLSVAKTPGMLWSVPVFGVNHLRGHAFSPFIDIKDWDNFYLILAFWSPEEIQFYSAWMKERDFNPCKNS